MLTIEMDNFDLGQICRSGQCFRMEQTGENSYRVNRQFLLSGRRFHFFLDQIF